MVRLGMVAVVISGAPILHQPYNKMIPALVQHCNSCNGILGKPWYYPVVLVV
jgi:hypothetical protein